MQDSHINHTMYVKVFFAILAVTVLTLIQPYIIGETLQEKVSIQMFLAVIKSSLIILYYMHLKYETKIFKLFVWFTILILITVFALTATDIIFRNQVFDLFN